jgi:hypothetical protein
VVKTTKLLLHPAFEPLGPPDTVSSAIDLAKSTTPWPLYSTGGDNCPAGAGAGALEPPTVVEVTTAPTSAVPADMAAVIACEILLAAGVSLLGPVALVPQELSATVAIVNRPITAALLKRAKPPLSMLAPVGFSWW